MIRRFCDFCNEELTEKSKPSGGKNSNRLAATIERGELKLTVEVMHSKDSVSNAGDVCKYCILDALMTLDDRPHAPRARPS